MTRRSVAAIAVAIAFAVGAVACSDDEEAARPTTSRPSSASTGTSRPSARATSTNAPPPSSTTFAPAGCGGAEGLLGTFLAGQAHPERFRISAFVVSTTDPTWARMNLPPPEPNPEQVMVDGTAVVAHCESGTWRVNSHGTSGVGCEPSVPVAVAAEIGWDC
jgi:hypothetical protein